MVKFTKIDKQQRKELNNLIRSAVKKLKISSKSERYFVKVGDYLVKYLIDINFPDNQFSLTITPSIKPYILDDIFWEVFDMADNSLQPMSLRAIGAFTVGSLMLTPVNVKMEWTPENIDMSEVEELVFNTLSDLHRDISNIVASFNDIEDYYSYAIDHGLTNENYHLTTMLMMIYNKKYEDAKNMAEDLLLNHKRGSFKNGDKWINEYIVDYCNERMEK